jgi:leader peptidase (prepilin peptidase) / N-methyltransferase
VIDLIQRIDGTPLGAFFTCILGLIFGSFYNVVILRLPDNISLAKEGSRCPKCKHPIPWYCNIPVVSYLALRGKCLFCKAGISIQYPLVELFTSLLFYGMYWKWGLTLRFLVYGIFLSALLVVSVIDLYLQIIPDEISLPGIPIGFIVCLITGDVLWWESLLGILLGGGSFLLIAWGYEKYSGREGLGGGDVKLLGMIGAWCGYQSLLPVIVISSALGSAIGVGLMVFKGKDFKSAIPFGPFLAIAAACYIFAGPTLLEWMTPQIQ